MQIAQIEWNIHERQPGQFSKLLQQESIDRGSFLSSGICVAYL